MGEFDEVPGTNEAAQLTVPDKQPQWCSWAEVPRQADVVAQKGPWFLELFAGTARLTHSVQEAGIRCLPPVDLQLSERVLTSVDVLDVGWWMFIMEILETGAVRFLHCGTPCNTYSAARQDDGGPPPLRDAHHPMGLPLLAPQNRALVFLGNLFMERTVEACLVVFRHGGDFTIENPLGSLLWLTQPMKQLQLVTKACTVDLDQCAFGAPSVKPTRLLCSHHCLTRVAARSPRDHIHEVFQGYVWSESFGSWVFRTKLAQEYPWPLCHAVAQAVLFVWSPTAQQFSSSYGLKASERKRPVGQPLRHRDHRQALAALKAQAAGYQLKRGALKPLLSIETEPGIAIQWALSIPHPLTAELVVDPSLQRAIDCLASSPEAVVQARQLHLQVWPARAQELLPHNDRLLQQIKDAPLRRLLRGCSDHETAQLGTMCHILLYYDMLEAAGSVDRFMPDLLLQGFPIVGPIARSGRWPLFEKEQKTLPIEHAVDRAWVSRKKIIARAQAVLVSENLVKIWTATMEDVCDGSCLGPFYKESEVDVVVQQKRWIPTQRFEVVQKNKVRGCDSATTNLINQITMITEKLQLPSTDSNVAALRYLRSKMPHEKLAGWVLDEKKAYRQVAIKPEHRMFSVIVLKDPTRDQVAFFVMVGHSFGLVSAVYNYNRRSAAINEILVSLFGLVAFSFYDDKYGFEPLCSVESAFKVAQSVHWWLGAQFDQKKLQLSTKPVILGVTYNLVSMVLEIKDDRRKDLVDEIESILQTNVLDPGSAGKLKGKLMFGASQLWGKIGRAFLRVISERQYARFAPTDQFKVDEPLERALQHWKVLINQGPPRPIDFRFNKVADAVIFTDGFSPDPRSHEVLPDRVGAVMFDRRLPAPLQFTEVIPSWLKQKWLIRKSQIVPVEMVAPILALETFRDRVVGSDVLLFIDSEAVEAALIKGYSSREDLCDLISVFWELVLELRVNIFIDRVATDANPADWPSRDCLEIGQRAGWSAVKAIWPAALKT